MTYEEMLDKIRAADVYVQGCGYKQGKVGHAGQRVVTGDEYVEVYWVAGGITGGTCWGDKADRAVTPDSPEELRELDKILEVLAPDITYSQFKKIDKKVKTGLRSGGCEWYGNYTKYAYKTLKLKDLYDVLSEMSLI